MNKNIKYIIEHINDYMGFNPAEITDGRPKQKVDTDVVNNHIYDYIPIDREDLRGYLEYQFKRGVTDFNGVCTSNITDFSYLFVGLDPKEIEISEWDVSNGKYFRHMFYNCIDLKCDVFKWNVHNGIDFEGMFYNCKWIEGDFRHWDFSNALRMNEMFYNCRRILLEPEKYVENKHAYFPETNEELRSLVRRFIRYSDKELNCINVSKVTDFSNIFKNLEGLYKVKIDKWDVSRGITFENMFSNCIDFNADLSGWDVSSGENFHAMFANCYKFNSNIKNWNVSSGRNFHAMFWHCRKFTKDLSKWDVSNATDIAEMFWEANEKLKKPNNYQKTLNRLYNV